MSYLLAYRWYGGTITVVVPPLAPAFPGAGTFVRLGMTASFDSLRLTGTFAPR